MSKLLRSLQMTESKKDSPSFEPLFPAQPMSLKDKKNVFIDYLLKKKQMESGKEPVTPPKETLELFEKFRDDFLKQVQVFLQAQSEEILFSLQKNQSLLQQFVQKWELFQLQQQMNEKIFISGEVQRALPSAATEREKNEDVVYMQNENKRLKSLTKKIIRAYYFKRFAAVEKRFFGKETVVSQPVLSADTGYLLQEIQKLETKKQELVQDNVQINQLSEELLQENERLRKALEKNNGI